MIKVNKKLKLKQFLLLTLTFLVAFFIPNTSSKTNAQVEIPYNFDYQLLSGYVYYYGMDYDYYYDYIPQSNSEAVRLQYDYADNSLYEPFLIYHANSFFVSDIRELYTFVVYLDVSDGEWAMADVNISVSADFVDINGDYHTVDYTQTANLNTATSSFTSSNLFLPITNYLYEYSIQQCFVTFFEVRLSWAYGSQTTENRFLSSTLVYNTPPL